MLIFTWKAHQELLHHNNSVAVVVTNYVSQRKLECLHWAGIPNPSFTLAGAFFNPLISSGSSSRLQQKNLGNISSWQNKKWLIKWASTVRSCPLPTKKPHTTPLNMYYLKHALLFGSLCIRIKLEKKVTFLLYSPNPRHDVKYSRASAVVPFLFQNCVLLKSLLLLKVWNKIYICIYV